MVITDGDVATKSVTKERWVKTRDKIRCLGMQVRLQDRFTPDQFPGLGEDVVSKDRRMIHFKTTGRLIGFVVYVAQTYTSLVLYLKGIYLSLNSWQSDWDEDGWLTPEDKRMQREGKWVVDGDPPN